MALTVVVYTGNSNVLEASWASIVAPIEKTSRIVHCHNLSSLELSIKKPISYQTLVILFIATQKELDAIITIRNQLIRFPLVIILPDRSAETVRKGHSLYPRFLTYIGEDAAILTQILERLHRRIEMNQPVPGEIGEYKTKSIDPGR
jgi:hypothetical protein